MTYDQSIQIAKKFSSELDKAGIPLQTVILFGSQITGKAGKWSDIDTCVVSPIFGRDRQSERVRLMKIAQKVSLDIEPHPYSPADFENKFDPLAREIKKTGIKIR